MAQLALSEARVLGRRFGGAGAPSADRGQLVQQLTLAHAPTGDLCLERAHMPIELGEQIAELRGQALRLLEMVVAARSREAAL